MFIDQAAARKPPTTDSGLKALRTRAFPAILSSNGMGIHRMTAGTSLLRICLWRTRISSKVGKRCDSLDLVQVFRGFHQCSRMSSRRFHRALTKASIFPPGLRRRITSGAQSFGASSSVIQFAAITSADSSGHAILPESVDNVVAFMPRHLKFIMIGSINLSLVAIVTSAPWAAYFTQSVPKQSPRHRTFSRSWRANSRCLGSQTPCFPCLFSSIDINHSALNGFPAKAPWNRPTMASAKARR